MTAAAPPVSENPGPVQVAVAPLPRLVRVTARQHRTALLSVLVAVVIMAVALLVTGVPMHEFAARHGADWQDTSQAGHDYSLEMQAFAVVCQLLAVLAGVFLGAPTVAREIENGTARFAWTQAASRSRWLLVQVLPVACLLSAAALGLGAEFGWWLAPFPRTASVHAGPWSPLLFNLSVLVLMGWVLFALTLGVVLGAAIRRTIPAMAATFACYGALWYAVSASWRMHYLAPVHRSLHVQFQGAGSYYGYYWAGHPLIMSETLGWPDGRLLSNADQLRPASWLTLHHIVLWATYQPASRYHVFQLIEVGWLIAASALLLAAAVALTRRSPA